MAAGASDTGEYLSILEDPDSAAEIFAMNLLLTDGARLVLKKLDDDGGPIGIEVAYVRRTGRVQNTFVVNRCLR